MNRQDGGCWLLDDRAAISSKVLRGESQLQRHSLTRLQLDEAVTLLRDEAENFIKDTWADFKT
jgi:hypothetical protein